MNIAAQRLHDQSARDLVAKQQQEARTALLHALQRIGLPTAAQLTPASGPPTIAATTRLEQHRDDRELVFATLNFYGWISLAARHNERVDAMQLLHQGNETTPGTGARLQLYLQHPHAAAPQWDPAA